MEILFLLPINSSYISKLDSDVNFVPSKELFIGKSVLPGDIFRTLLKFDMSKMPIGSVINKATLRLFINENDSSEVNLLQIHSALKDFSQGSVTWDNAPTYEEPQFCAPITAENINNYIYIDITSLAQTWHSDISQNTGIILTSDESAISLLSIFGIDNENELYCPTLIIEYLNETIANDSIDLIEEIYIPIPADDLTEIGPPGPQGDIGPTGPQGEMGPTGFQGDIGPMGPKGDIGPTGPQGIIGPIGPKGDIGPIGPKGDIGPTGPKGDTGPVGPKGDIGPTGPKGDTGPVGPKGDIGPTGSQGIIGPIGPKGDIGPTGPKGDIGPMGPKGVTGAAGTNFAGLLAYGYIFKLATVLDSTIPGGVDIPFSNNGPLSNMLHTPGSTAAIVTTSGVYEILFSIHITSGIGTQIAIAVNGIVEPTTPLTAMIASGEIIGHAILILNAGDVISIRNNSLNPLSLVLAPAISSQLTLKRLV